MLLEVGHLVDADDLLPVLFQFGAEHTRQVHDTSMSPPTILNLIDGHVPSLLNEFRRQFVEHKGVRRREFNTVHLPTQSTSQFCMESHELRVAFPYTPLVNDIFLHFARCDTHLARNFIFDIFFARFFAQSIASDGRKKIVLGVGGVDSDRPAAPMNPSAVEHVLKC